MMKRIATTIAAAAMACNIGLSAQASTTAITVTPHPAQATDTISRMIYGQFAEHLGGCIYGGIWVGEDSPIPNIHGYRNDAIEAIRALGVPVLRWPGGCFADDYHWRDGIGPRESRPTLINYNWGGTREDNSFGTHEFLNLCELVGCEPYISGNMGSGTVGEMAQWVEYMTAADGPMAKERAANGRTAPWRVKYFGVGNESWGCGGNMRPEYYADLYRRYSTYLHDCNGNRLFKIASGASDYDYNWTEVLMKQIGAGRMPGISLHYYSIRDWNDKGSATAFTDREYYNTLGKALEIDTVITRHLAIMDRYDPQHRTKLLVDEWGTWWDEEPGTIAGHLYQQNTMRDAMVAALTLNIFHRHAGRIGMANIAQIANVLQAMWLTKDDKMVLTPTYHVFRMYAPHKDSVAIPLTYDDARITDDNGRPVATFDATASRSASGAVTLALTNASLTDTRTVTIALTDMPRRIADAQILTAAKPTAHNTFDEPTAVAPKNFTEARISANSLNIKLPPLSIVSITLADK